MESSGLTTVSAITYATACKMPCEFFEVTVINKDCDYSEICDKYQPNLALFESGYETYISKKIIIKNTHVNPAIPKIGFHNADPWTDCRVGFIGDMDSWDIDTFFQFVQPLPNILLKLRKTCSYGRIH